MPVAKRRKLQNVANSALSPFAWTAARSEAAILVAEDKLSDEEISQRLGIARMTLLRWKATREFAARVEQLRRQTQARIERVAIAQQVRRLTRQNERWERMQAVIEARAKHFSEVRKAQQEAAQQDPKRPVTIAPEAVTGLVVRRVRPATKYSSEIEEWITDTGLLQEARELEKQVAQELGQFANNAAGGDDEGAYTMEELLILYRRATTRTRANGRAAIDITPTT